MKIVHLCLSGPYTEGFSYQENLLSKYHKRRGDDVSIVATVCSYNAQGSQEELAPSRYINTEGIAVVRVPYRKIGILARKLRWVKGIKRALETENPDLIFLHGVQSLSNRQVISYLRKHPAVRLICDNHCDEYNAFSKGMYQKVLHRSLWRIQAMRLSKYAEIVWGVLPSRVQFLKDVYGLPSNKCDLLLMGADDDLIMRANHTSISMMQDDSVENDGLLVVSGGKIDHNKTQTLDLMKAFSDERLSNCHLLLFGSVSDEIKDGFNSIMENSENIKYVGWANSVQIYQYLSMADLVCFPGEHSVLWEETAGIGKPMLLHFREGQQHLSINGNACYLPDNSNSTIISDCLVRVMEPKTLLKMKNAAENIQMRFRYSSIAERSLTHNVCK